MIVPKHFDHGLYFRIPEARRGNFAISKTVIKKGTWIRMYSPLGAFYTDKFSSDYPVVKLVELYGELPGPADTPDASAIFDRGLWMSDTPLEQAGLLYPLTFAHGNVLVFGLGLGLYPYLLAKHNKSVDSITIVEKEKDVVDLVFPHIKRAMMNVIVMDAEQFIELQTSDSWVVAVTGKKYPIINPKFDFIYIDIWPDFVAPIQEADKWLEKVKPLLAEKGEARVWLQELYDRVHLRLPKSPIANPGPPAIYDPCLICGKKLRYDFGGLCLDCADAMHISEIYAHKESRVSEKGGEHNGAKQ